MSSGDEELRDLERAAQTGDRVALEQFLYAKIRRAPDLVMKLVRRVIRLERVVTTARMNEDEYYPEVTLEELHAFVDKEAPDRPLHPGRLKVDGEWPASSDGVRGGAVNLLGGRAAMASADAVTVAGADQTTLGHNAAPAIDELRRLVANLTERVAALESRAVGPT